MLSGLYPLLHPWVRLLFSIILSHLSPYLCTASLMSNFGPCF